MKFKGAGSALFHKITAKDIRIPEIQNALQFSRKVRSASQVARRNHCRIIINSYNEYIVEGVAQPPRDNMSDKLSLKGNRQRIPLLYTSPGGMSLECTLQVVSARIIPFSRASKKTTGPPLAQQLHPLAILWTDHQQQRPSKPGKSQIWRQKIRLYILNTFRARRNTRLVKNISRIQREFDSTMLRVQKYSS